MKRRKASLWSGVRRLFRWKETLLPCVGVVVLGGCLALIVVPDDSAPLKPSVGGLPGLPTVIVDPGHGGKDDGTKWRGLAEKTLTLDEAQRVERLLKVAGFPTELTRREDVFVSLADRVKLANQYQDAVFVSIHFNSDHDGSSSGVQTHYPKDKDILAPDWSWVGLFSKPAPPSIQPSEVLAGYIETAVISRTDARNRGVLANDFYVIHHTRCPGVLVEGGFVSNSFEAQLLRSEEYRERIAQGIAEGVMAYVKSRAQPSTPPPAPGTNLVQALR